MTKEQFLEVQLKNKKVLFEIDDIQVVGLPYVFDDSVEIDTEEEKISENQKIGLLLNNKLINVYEQYINYLRIVKITQSDYILLINYIDEDYFGSIYRLSVDNTFLEKIDVELQSIDIEDIDLD